MSVNYILVCLNIFFFQMGTVCFAEDKPKIPFTFNGAVQVWKKESCIFPEKFWYEDNPFVDFVPPLYKLCQVLDEDKKDDADKVFRLHLCQALYKMSIFLCRDSSFQPFVEKCLSPAALKEKRFVSTKESEVCLYISNLHPGYNLMINDTKLCKQNCGDLPDSMIKVCELYASIFYKFNSSNGCWPLPDHTEQGKSSQRKPTIVSNNDTAAAPKNDTVKIPESVMTTPNIKDDNSTSSELITTTPKVEGDKSSTELKKVAPKEDENMPGQEPVTTPKMGSESKSSTEAIKILPVPDREDLSLHPSDDKSDRSTTENPKLETSSVEAPKPAATDSKNEVLKILVPSSMDSTFSSILLSSMIPTPKSEKVFDSSTSTTNKSEDNGDSELLDTDNDNEPGDTEEKQDDTIDADPKDKTKPSSSKEKVDDNDLIGNEVNEEEPHLNVKGKEGVRPQINAAEDENTGSGHFLAYFLTAVVICISGYVIYHNKQKILAFVIEGRNSGRNGRQRSKDVKYTQLKSNVEEVLPSLEQTATSKNFVY